MRPGFKPEPDDAVYINRELSWLRFNRRVLEEAASDRNPLLERLRFLSIFESNLDEFYMVRVSGLIEQFEAGVLTTSIDGLTPTENLRAIAAAARPLRQRAAEIYATEIAPALAKEGVTIAAYADLSLKARRDLDAFFVAEVFPLLTPLILHPAPSLPFISNRSLNLAVELGDDPREPRLARVKIPTVIPRAIRTRSRKLEFVLMEDLVRHNLPSLFPGVKILGAHLFRVVRDADVEIRELEADDLIAAIEETLRLRRFGAPVLMEHEPEMPPEVRATLMRLLELDEDDVLPTEGVLGMEVFNEIARVDRPTLRYPGHRPYLPDTLATSDGIFETVSKHDVLLHHPFDSFRPVEVFVASVAKDPKVVGLKQTLYRVGTESPIVESLLEAAEAGKQVAAMVELKARFDESNNLVWARQLERAGVHVTYGFAETKTHCKLSLVIRREEGGVKGYAHIGTGNYNPATARHYTDLGLFTDDPDICQDIAELFNDLTGFSHQQAYRKLLVAPANLREGILARIRREMSHRKAGRPAGIVLKMNSLVDPDVIDALYDASRAGVKCDLLVRGSCCLRPGVKGMSEKITVLSIIGRFLEHSRIYWFANGGDPEVLIGSADAMRRNFDRRIEVLVPVEDPKLKDAIKTRILDICLKDDARAWELHPTGDYRRRTRLEGKPFDSQAWFMDHPLSRELLKPPAEA